MKNKLFSISASLFIGFVLNASAASLSAEIEIPKLAEISSSNQTIAPLILRFQADAESIKHTHDITASTKRDVALRSLYSGWLAAIASINYQQLGLEDQIDFALLSANCNIG